MMENIYIIGDVHGCYKTLLALIGKLPQKDKSHICFVGDLCDKGNNSKDVIEFVKSNNYDCVLGNHEIMFIDNATEILKTNKIDEESSFWINKCGGKETLENYDNDKKLLQEHISYFKTLPLYLEYKHLKTKDNRHLVVSHSHILNTWKYKDYDKDSQDYKSFENDCLYSRYKSFDNSEIFNVFGHTPVQNPQINDFKANIDLGCFFKSENESGCLCALAFPSMKTYMQENIED
ncbi:MAG: metallophosphoesterase [Campylobacterota bacterium]